MTDEYIIKRKKKKGILEGLIEGALYTGAQVGGYYLKLGVEAGKSTAGALRIIGEGLTEETCKKLDKLK